MLDCGSGSAGVAAATRPCSRASGVAGAGLAAAGLCGGWCSSESGCEVRCSGSEFIGGVGARGRSGKDVGGTSPLGVAVGGFIAADGGANGSDAYCSEVGRLPPLEVAGVLYVVLTDRAENTLAVDDVEILRTCLVSDWKKVGVDVGRECNGCFGVFEKDMVVESCT